MTSTTDEIANLRAALAAIRRECVSYADARDKGPDTWPRKVAQMAMDGLKTQRVSKIVEQDTLRLDWVLEHCMVMHHPAPAYTNAANQLTSRAVIDAMRGLTP